MSSRLLDLDSKRRDNILNSALKEFVIKGYDNASTNVIAKEAGISKALMFHYVSSKQELFLFVYDYFTKILEEQYFMKIDYTQKDMLERLYQICQLQFELIKRYPWILEMEKLSRLTDTVEINAEIEARVKKRNLSCSNQTFTAIFNLIDESLFRDELDVEIVKEIIFWVYTGITNKILDNIRETQMHSINYDVMNKIKLYLVELRRLFYK